MKHGILSVTLLMGAVVSANDGAYLSRGGILYPTQETRIALTKEVLSFTCRDGNCAVEVLFEFTNPEAQARTLLVGFQAPSSTGDVPDSLSAVSQIRDLKVMVDGTLLPVVRKAAECEDCPLGEISDHEFQGDDPGVFVYLFEVTFKPGINRVNHSYTFPASSHVYFDRIYDYILRTGAKWASGSIGELTVMIDLGPNTYFYVNDVFGPTADWSIVGTGKFTSTTFDNGQGEGTTARMVRMLSGKLMINVKALRPEKNIEFGEISAGTFFGIPTEPSGLNEQVAAALRDRTTDHAAFRTPPLTKDNLRLLRNLLYARYGYAFKDAALQRSFSSFAWYVPDPNLRAEDIPFTVEDQQFLEEIIRREKE